MREVFLRVLDEYLTASAAPLVNHPLADHIRNRFSEILQPLLPSTERFFVKGSPGQGNWGKVPWIATFDSLITSTAQNGYYITYLFKSDMSGVYLNLKQGVTDIHRRYKAKAKDVLEIKARDFRAQLGELPAGLQSGRIALGEGLPAAVDLYNYGSICSKLYSRDKFPADDELIEDYRRFLGLYAYLVDNDNTTVDSGVPSDRSSQIGEYFEDTRRRIKHDRIERNLRLAKAAKVHHGYVCQVCTFDFEKVYGKIGKDYIEAHHLVPLGSLAQQRIALNPATDFAVLCANCHRMIHRMGDGQSVAELKQLLLTSRLGLK